MGSELETPKYQLIDKDSQFEIRMYEPMIIAITEINSSYSQSATTGFRRIANYIFGRIYRKKEDDNVFSLMGKVLQESLLSKAGMN